jgi:hypothetical protein
MDNKAQLQERLTAVQAKINRLTKPSQNDPSEFFHLGMVGTGGRNAQRLNQRKLEVMDRSIDNAVELSQLYAERESLQRQIDGYDVKIARQQARQAKREVALERIRSAKPGMEVVTWTGSTVTVKRMNQKSITTMSGSRYTFEELVDVVAAQ